MYARFTYWLYFICPSYPGYIQPEVNLLYTKILKIFALSEIQPISAVYLFLYLKDRMHPELPLFSKHGVGTKHTNRKKNLVIQSCFVWIENYTWINIMTCNDFNISKRTKLIHNRKSTKLCCDVNRPEPHDWTRSFCEQSVCLNPITN